jgi:hypothetical protein
MKEMMKFLGIFFLFLTGVYASTGVIPASYSIDFSPNIQRDFTFTFIGDDTNENNIYIEAEELSEYFSIKDVKRVGSNTIVVISMKLPKALQKAGNNRVRIGSREVSESEGVNIIMDVRGIIDIFVPYPEKYADINFNVDYANKGENALYNLTIYSKGEDDIFVNPRLELRSSGKIVDTIYLEGVTIYSMESKSYIGQISTNEYYAGDYNLTAIVDYGGDLPRSETTVFRLGELKMRITNYTSSFVKGKYNRIDVSVESLWNNNIDDVYVNGSIVGYPYITFQSPSYSIAKWGTMVFGAYFDTSDIKEDNFQISIDVNYEGQVTNQVVNVYFKKEVNWILIGIIIGVSIIVILLVIVFLLMRNKNGNKK